MYKDEDLQINNVSFIRHYMIWHFKNW